MGTYDSKRLDVAIQYIRRMAEGRNPVNNRPAPGNEVLTNINVNRCLKFVEEVLADVRSTGGVVGGVQKSSAAPKPSIADIFPYEMLSGFSYEQDQQISYFLRQLTGMLPEEQAVSIPTTMVTDWLRENGYLEKRMFEDIGKENSVPTEKGIELGLYAEKAGNFPNEYYRVYYNKKAQQFLVDHLRQILTETAEIRARNRKEKKRAALSEKQKAQRMQTGPVEKTGQEAMPPRSTQGAGKKSFSGRGRVEDDPGFASLVSSIPDDYAYSQEVWADQVPPDAYDPSFMGEGLGQGWESADDGLPW